LVSGVNRLLGLGISLARALKILLSLGLNPPNRDRALSTLGSFAGLAAMLRRLEADEEERAGVRIREAEAQKRAENREQRIVDIMEGLVNMLRGPQ